MARVVPALVAYGGAAAAAADPEFRFLRLSQLGGRPPTGVGLVVAAPEVDGTDVGRRPAPTLTLRVSG